MTYSVKDMCRTGVGTRALIVLFFIYIYIFIFMLFIMQLSSV